jgi:hypothetical protein
MPQKVTGKQALVVVLSIALVFTVIDSLLGFEGYSVLRTLQAIMIGVFILILKV